MGVFDDVEQIGPIFKWSVRIVGCFVLMNTSYLLVICVRVHSLVSLLAWRSQYGMFDQLGLRRVQGVELVVCDLVKGLHRIVVVLFVQWGGYAGQVGTKIQNTIQNGKTDRSPERVVRDSSSCLS